MRKLYMLGAGRMGEAILLGLNKTQSGLATPCIIERKKSQRELWKKRGYHAVSSVGDIGDQDIIILAVPPQQFGQALIDNPVMLSHRGPVISVMAGISHATLVRSLGHANIVRSIPNTPSEVSEGMTIFYAPVEASDDLLDVSQNVFNSIGKSIQVFDESQLDTSTALVGGGPALIAYFVQALQEYALVSGFDSENAATIANQLLYGTARLLQVNGKTAFSICKEVQTPGGTTERAISYLAQENFNGLVGEALSRAAERSTELGAHDSQTVKSTVFEGRKLIRSLPVKDELERYALYFGVGQSIKLIDDPCVFKVSEAGCAFGSYIAKSIARQNINARFLDVGTGSGVHSLVLRKFGVVNITATDVSLEAIQVAQMNEFDNLGSQTIDFRQSDLFSGLEEGDSFDVILFNPPGWQTPSNIFLDVLKASASTKGLSIETMFYGECTLKRFFEKAPHYLKAEGKVIVGLNSLVGIDAVLTDMCKAQSGLYECVWSLIERHDFSLDLYTEQWRALGPLICQEIERWVSEDLAYCRFNSNGEIIWSYEIVEVRFLLVG